MFPGGCGAGKGRAEEKRHLGADLQYEKACHDRYVLRHRHDPACAGLPYLFAPGFYKMDFSELPILVGSFAFGPVAGVMMEFVKILLKLCIKGTSTAFIGDLANFVVGCSLIIPASAVYSFKKTKKSAIIACIVGTLVMTVFGTAFNAVYLLPAFSKFYGMPLDAILAMGAEVNPLAKEGSIVSFVVACVAPMNLIKGTLVSVVTLLIYKPLSPIIKTGHKA